MLGLLAAAVVAVSEAVLFTLWQRRADKRAAAKKTFVRRVVKVEYPADHPAQEMKVEEQDGLRKRRTGEHENVGAGA